RVIELHRLQGYDHTGDMLVTYLPREGILGEPDAFTPPAQAGAPLIPPAVPSAKALSDNIKRLKLNVKTIAPFHGNRMTTVAELNKAAAGGGPNKRTYPTRKKARRTRVPRASIVGAGPAKAGSYVLVGCVLLDYS